MKKILFQTLILAIVLFSACEEQPIEVTQEPINSDRKILIEEFTGANCAACPAGAKIIETLRDTYGDKIVAVGIHTTVSGPLGKPLPGSAYDLRTNTGDDLASFLGGLSAIPAAVFNRTKFESESKMAVLAPDTWPTFVLEELEKAPVVKLETDLEYRDDTRTLTINVVATPLENKEGDFRVGVMITESNIIDFQNDSGTIDSMYQNNHILRVLPTTTDPALDNLPGPGGDQLATTFVTNSPITKTYTIQLPEEDGTWIASNINIVTFVSEVNDQDGTIKVLQADEAHLGE